MPNRGRFNAAILPLRIAPGKIVWLFGCEKRETNDVRLCGPLPAQWVLIEQTRTCPKGLPTLIKVFDLIDQNSTVRPMQVQIRPACPVISGRRGSKQVVWDPTQNKFQEVDSFVPLKCLSRGLAATLEKVALGGGNGPGISPMAACLTFVVVVVPLVAGSMFGLPPLHDRVPMTSTINASFFHI
jgi:hypothetical protein